MVDISVVVPIYNSEQTIASCIESILQQHIGCLEVILVDDGCTDNSGAICDNYAICDNRIKVVHQANKGRTEARAVGVRKAIGEWICFVDSDDRLPEHALKSLYRLADDETDIVLGNGQSLPNERRDVVPIDDFRHITIRAEGTIGVPWGSLYRRCKLTDWLFDLPRDIVNGEDYLFWLRLVFSTEKPVHVLYEPVYDKGDDHTSNSFKWTADYCYRLNELRKASIPAELHQEYLSDMVCDRLENMYAVALWSKRSEWKQSPYYLELLRDMKTAGMKLPLKSKLYLTLPYLLQRRYCLFLLIVACFMLILNLMDAPTLSDDMIYRFMWNADESAEVESINSLSDLFHSQYIHYLSVNGRFVAHFLAQAFLVFIPPAVLQILNTLLFVLLVHFCTSWVVREERQRLFVAVIVCFLLFVVFQGFRTAILWGLGSFNYLWTLVAVIALILWMRSIDEKHRILHFVLSPLALLAGWSHEALSLPLAMTFVVYGIVNGKQLFRRPVTLYMGWFMVGTALCLLSPALWSRSAESVSLMSRLLSGAVNYLFNIRVFWLLVIVEMVLWKKNRRLLKSHYQEHGYEYVALCVALGIVLLCGTNLERVGFFVDFISMLLLLSLLIDITTTTWRRRLMWVCCILMLLCYVSAYMVRSENLMNWKLAEQQMKTPGREVIAVSQPVKGENPLMDYFREHYINSSFDFGFYCSYMGFDANDINMRCAARLYHQEKLVFLPADVVERIETDTTAYSHYELDRNKTLYIWRLKSEQLVSTVRFILKEEDTSKLWPHQRLLAYHDDSFELDDFRFEVVQVAGRAYLVFTRPTTNIYRRIDSIKIE